MEQVIGIVLILLYLEDNTSFCGRSKGSNEVAFYKPRVDTYFVIDESDFSSEEISEKEEKLDDLIRQYELAETDE